MKAIAGLLALAASMRPRSVERGKAMHAVSRSIIPSGFNEAALSRARKVVVFLLDLGLTRLLQ